MTNSVIHIIERRTKIISFLIVINAIDALTEHYVNGITANREGYDELVFNSMFIVTAPI